jgi:hypothetical protein
MGRPLLQPTLPLVEPDGQTHRRDCDCPRCDAGFRPSEGQRAQAARRWQERQDRENALQALEKKRARDRLRALRTQIRLEEEERRTAASLRELAEARARLKADPRLEALLDSRRAGLPVDEAIEEAERRPSARSTRAGRYPSSP